MNLQIGARAAWAARHALRAAIFLLLVFTGGPLLAQLDPPHDGNYGISCSACHLGHFAFGDQFDSVAGNANLCLSCHIEGGLASLKPFAPANQAIPWPGITNFTAGSGNSHRWDSKASGRVVWAGNPAEDGARGLVAVGTYTGRYAQTYTVVITVAGDSGTARFNWTGSATGSGKGTNVFTGFGVPLENGLALLFLSFRSAPAFRVGDQWQVLVRPNLTSPSNPDLQDITDNGKMVCSTCHDQHSQFNTPFDPAAPNYLYTGTGAGRHFLRAGNDADQMCRECHAPLFVTNGIMGSHPIGMAVVSNAFYRPPAALPLTKADNRASCSTCHQVHFSPSGDGSLARVTNENALCVQCHALADTTTPARHLDPALGTLWPGGQYGSLFPRVSDTAERGQCGNCHQVHGWPDPSTTTNDYKSLLVEKEENLCYTCHDGSPVTKNLRSNFARTYTHPVTLAGRHSPTEDGVPYFYGTTNRHSECVDCHNPHRANKDTVTAVPPNASKVLNSVPRVSVNNVSSNSFTFTFRSAADPTPVKEYEMCFVCHSSWTTQPAGQGNYAAKFNLRTASYHPVEGPGKNTNIALSAFTNGWTGAKTMFCTDCHTSDDTSIRGPHGSTNRYILKKPYTASASVNAAAGDLCFDCHTYSTYTSTSSTAKAGTRWRGAGDYSKHIHASKNCYGCHDSHAGGSNPFLIVLGRDLTAYTKTSTGGSCTGRSGCHGSESYTVGYAR